MTTRNVDVVSLSAWRFDTPQAAESTLPRLQQLVADGTIAVDDAVVLSWPPGLRKPATRIVGSIDGPGVLWSGSWGMLLSLVFLAPDAGAALGAAAGAVAGGLADFGIDDDFVMRVRDAVTPGTSALLVFAGDDARDTLARETDADEVVRCRLQADEWRRLRTALG